MKPNALTNCQSKGSYDSEEKAQDTANWLLKEKDVDVKVYKCWLCEKFHLSSK